MELYSLEFTVCLPFTHWLVTECWSTHINYCKSTYLNLKMFRPTTSEPGLSTVNPRYFELNIGMSCLELISVHKMDFPDDKIQHIEV